MRWASAARSAQADTTVLVVVGMMTSGRMIPTTASAPAYKRSRLSRLSTSSCKNTGGKSPTNKPQQPIISATWYLLEYWSSEDIHHRHAAQPSTATSNQT